ncbi:MAG: recombination mediator RecR [bacterium]|nr:recombination mediator RecR [bacterium]
MAYPQSIQKLIDAFTRFPGIGPRQAARFAFHLLGENRETVTRLADTIKNLHGKVGFCASCYKSIELTEKPANNLCEHCRGGSRAKTVLMVVEKEADLANIERTGKFNGVYHVLNGTIDPLDSSAPARLHIKELFERTKTLKNSGNDVEIILATNATTDGDSTALYLERVLRPLEIKISRLGRGLTTGTELEYSDEMTIVNALANRK